MLLPTRRLAIRLGPARGILDIASSLGVTTLPPEVEADCVSAVVGGAVVGGCEGSGRDSCSSNCTPLDASHSIASLDVRSFRCFAPVNPLTCA